MLVFPEFHLSDYPPQRTFRQAQVKDILKIFQRNEEDVVISGYVEEDLNVLYSSCMILDGRKEYNLRKRNPYKDETSIISGGESRIKVLNLSIGLSCFFICWDIKEITEPYIEELFRVNKIENVFLISAMLNSFSKNVDNLSLFCERYRVKKLIISDRFHGKEIRDLEKSLYDSI